MLTVYLAKFKAFEAFSDPSSTYPYSLIFTRGSHKLGTLHGWYHTPNTQPYAFIPPVFSSPNGSPIPSPSSEVHAVKPSHPKTHSNITSSKCLSSLLLSHQAE